MTRDEFFTEMEALLELPKGTIQEDGIVMETDGWSSMAILDIMALADERFGAQVKPAAVRACTTWNDIFRLLSAK